MADMRKKSAPVSGLFYHIFSMMSKRQIFIMTIRAEILLYTIRIEW